MATNEANMIHPNDRIVHSGVVPFVDTYRVEIAATMLPGRLVKTGTKDSDIVVGTVNSAVIGWLGYEQTAKKYRPSTIDTIYVQYDQVAVLSGGGFRIVASGIGGVITKGAKVIATAAGEVCLAAAATVTVASGTTTVLSTGAQPAINVAGSLPSGGMIIGIACEYKDCTSSADIIIQSLI